MAGRLNGTTVLVVEDEFLILVDLEHLLEGEGARITSATSLEEALSLPQEDYDAAVLDVRLPDGDVYPLAHRLSQRHVPLVFHSGHVQSESIAETFPEAVTLAKPVHEKVLIAALERQVATRH